jgi:hypothetical protein
MNIFRRKVGDDYDALIEAIGPLLRGKGPDLQAAVLTELVSKWVIGHHRSVRASVLARHVQAVRDQIELNEEASVRGRDPEIW